MDARKIDALDQWCMCMLLGIKWYQFVRNDDVRRLTMQPKLCYNPVAPAYPIWAYYAHGRQCRCQEDPVSLPSGRLEKTTGSSPHHVAQHHLTGSETQTYAPWSSRFGSEPPSVEDDVDVWCYAIVSCMPETTTNKMSFFVCFVWFSDLNGVLIPLSSVLCVKHNSCLYGVKIWQDVDWLDSSRYYATEMLCCISVASATVKRLHAVKPASLRLKLPI